VRRSLLFALLLAVVVAAPAAWAATVNGTKGPDRIAVQDNGVKDRVRCGSGRDIVTADLFDVIAADCEVVSRQLSRDSTTAFQAQHATQVEPDSFAFGRTIVAAFQSGRYTNGGAAAIGWATSQDAGGTWRSEFLASGEERVSDPSVAYDVVHGTWLIVTLGVSRGQLDILLSRSPDGVAWSAATAIVSPPPAEEGFDKEWIACDNWATSPFRGRCYLSYLNVTTNQLETRWSGDGGLTWSAAVVTSAGTLPKAEVNGAFPVVRPDGSLIVGFMVIAPFSNAGDDWIGASRSTDGGATFSAATRVADLELDDVVGMRAPPLPSADVDASGRVYIAWAGCRTRDGCAASDIVLATSADGVTWPGPIRVPTRNPGDRTAQFLPGLAVDPGTGGRGAHVAIAYYSLREPDSCALTDCLGLNVSVIQSASSGTAWGRPQRLTSNPMRLSWLAEGGIGQMVGDYISTSWVGGRPIPVFSLASQPTDVDVQRQSIFAGTQIG
jgi:hypothetical protein